MYDLPRPGPWLSALHPTDLLAQSERLQITIIISTMHIGLLIRRRLRLVRPSGRGRILGRRTGRAGNHLKLGLRLTLTVHGRMASRGVRNGTDYRRGAVTGKTDGRLDLHLAIVGVVVVRHSGFAALDV